MTDANSRFSSQAARAFSDRYKSATSEKQLAQSFWRDFFHGVCGIPDLLAAGIEFEFPVRSSEGRINFIDCFWSGVLLIEHKSAGKDLDAAEKQAREYLVGLSPAQRPPIVMVSDFRKIRIIEVLLGRSMEFSVEELPVHLDRIESILGKSTSEATRIETSADQKAVELMAKLFIEFEKAGYGGHEVSVFLVRILFLNFGDDTRMWKRKGKGLFSEFTQATSPDGMGVGGRVQELFQILDTPIEKRPSSLSETLVDFPYVNGGLFKEQLPIFSFTSEMRRALVNTTEYDWSKISPAIFGAMFQTVKSKEDRRSLGEHYTSEENILKVIRPLFLDDYLAKLSNGWDSANLLKKLKAELSNNHYLDPACGSGNFLVVAYKRLREIELKIDARLQELEGRQGQVYLDGKLGLSVHLGQFSGIEINEWSSQIAVVAMFLADHQANLAMEEVVGTSPNRFPLQESANIQHANALRLEWSEVVPFGPNTFVMGNPPFCGSYLQDKQQKSDTSHVWGDVSGSLNLDFVANWFLLAAKNISKHGGHAGLVSTNSVTQGEQPAVIWGELERLNINIDFAHRTFSWTNEAKGKAAVHCVIIGFSSSGKPGKKLLWTYEHVKSAPILMEVSNINPYLVPGPSLLVTPHSNPLVGGIPEIVKGSQPTDAGHLSDLSQEDVDLILSQSPGMSKYIKRFIGARELIHNELRYCLWLVNADPSDVKASSEVLRRISEVRDLRLASNSASTQKAAKKASEFQSIRQPSNPYIAIPRHSSEDRDYVPMGRFDEDVIAGDALSIIPDPSLLIFGWLQSKAFNLWNKAVSGRLESRTRISNTITYNNFPFPEVTAEQLASIEKAVEEVLASRREFPDSSLADLYDSRAMPSSLRKAHQELDKATNAALGLKQEVSDEVVLALLFERYQLLAEAP
jgi:hypothetical protein